MRRSSDSMEVPCCSCHKAFRTSQKQPSKLVTISDSTWNVTREKTATREWNTFPTYTLFFDLSQPDEIHFLMTQSGAKLTSHTVEHCSSMTGGSVTFRVPQQTSLTNVCLLVILFHVRYYWARQSSVFSRNQISLKHGSSCWRS